jgi:DNA-directed RNA polymerase specialized sigma24 family protein
VTEEEFDDELRRSAFAVAYRMLGSVSEAEDVVQDEIRLVGPTDETRLGERAAPAWIR